MVSSCQIETCLWKERKKVVASGHGGRVHDS